MRTSSLTWSACLTVLASFALASCSAGYFATARERTIGNGDVGSERSKLTGFLRAKSTRQPIWYEEQHLPREVAASSVADEATITRLAPAEVCLQLTVRSGPERDIPLSAYVIEVDGERANVGEERIRAVEHAYVGEGALLRARSRSGARVDVVAPRNEAFRVTERTGDVCAPRVSEDHVRLLLRREDENAWMAFEWHIR